MDACNRRIKIFWGAVLLLFALVFCRVCAIGGVYRDFYLAQCLKFAAQEGTFTPHRGDICDRDGVRLAWSERFFDFYLASDLPQNITLPRALELAGGALHSHVGRPVRTPEGLLLKRRLSVRELVHLKDFLRRYPFFYVRQRIERLQIGDPRVRVLLGEVRGGHGISGLEQKHDRQLAGTPGRYRVLLDRNRRRIPQSLELVTPPCSGNDLRLEQTLKEMTEAADAK